MGLQIVSNRKRIDSPTESNADTDKPWEDRGADKTQAEPVYACKPVHINFLSLSAG